VRSDANPVVLRRGTPQGSLKGRSFKPGTPENRRVVRTHHDLAVTITSRSHGRMMKSSFRGHKKVGLVVARARYRGAAA